MPRRIGPALVAVLALTGCAVAATLRSYDVTPSGLERTEQRLRVWLSRARSDSAAWPAASALPGDQLLRTLYEGTFAFYNRKFRQAGEKFDEADRITEARYTRSLSQNALAMLTNDRELDFEPGINERLLIHYYGALSFIGAGDLEGAAVEARKLGYLLEKFGGDLTDRDRSSRTMLRWFAGAVFEAAGERNDALVSYRNARALAGDSVRGADDDRLPVDGLVADSGDVLVVVEQGFVAFPVPFDISIPLYQHEARYYDSDADRSRQAWMSGRVGLRMRAQLAGMPGGGLYWGQTPGSLVVANEFGMMTAVDPDSVSMAYRGGHRYNYRYDPRWGGLPVRAAVADRILKLSIPVYRVPRGAGTPRVATAAGAAAPFAWGNLSEAEVADFDRERAWTYTRAVLRVAVKAIAAEAAEQAARKAAEGKKGGKKDEANAARWGRFFGFLTSASGAILERADTRSWNLLPHSVSLVRVRLPAGRQTVRLTAPGGADGTIEVPDVLVRAGQLTFASRRFWGSEAEW
ncbi:MAG: hypothetical protein HYX65_02525 [Gemmatimonadetes bacterium]|nr:hypothetical protein [Gemmatimonadota bacterium]